MIFKKIILSFLILYNFIGFSQSDINEGELIVLLEKTTTATDFCKEINDKNKTIELSVKECISQRLNVWLVSYKKDAFFPQDALNLISKSEKIKIAQFNHLNITTRGDTCPSDPNFFPEQWNLNNTGQNSGTVGADIDACKAWGITTRNTTVQGDTIVVAVIDDGFYLQHEDLNFFTNYNEIPNNGIDDDGNGYIDDRQGWNTYLDTGLITSRGHGTHVSGIIGAKANNGTGIAGVNWGMKILPIQGSSRVESTVLKSYGYALEMRALYNATNGQKGAFVVTTNSSFGVDYANRSGFPLWCAFYDSLGAYGILSCAATINQNINVDIIGDMPTTCQSDYLITVTNTTRNDTKSLAGFGPKNIDLGAPGASINSTYPNNTYISSSGTSQSCPHVSGAVAFMYAAACDDFISLYKQKPDSIALKVKKAILNNGDQLASLYGLSVSGNRLNLYNSALYLLSNEPCKPNVVIKMPNVFTPNNDGINDHFYPLEIKGVNEATLTVINRWGQEVFKSKDLLSGWNGKYKEKDCSDGVYFWILKYTDSYGVERSMKGSVTLT